MCRLSSLVPSPIVVLAVIVCANLCQGETGPDKNQLEQSIIGPWNPDSAKFSINGAKKDIPRIPKNPFSVIITDKLITMRIGEKTFAEMPYTLDSKQTPAAINAKFQEQDMLGIWGFKGNRLRISLNEAKKGRPKDFGAADNDMDMVLHRYTGQPLFVINAYGSDLHQIPATGEYLSCSSPKWSCEGKIAYNACRRVFGENWEDSHIFTINTDGSSPKDLGDGAMPSWSPDGKKIAFSRYSTGGVWIMDADGSNKKLIEEKGWNADWSPTNPDEVAYITYPGGPVPNVTDATSGNIVVRNLKTNEVRTLLDRQYNYNAWYMKWSPDGKGVCFLGELPSGGSELAIVSAEGQKKGFKVLMPNDAIEHVKEFSYFFSWRPDGKRLLLSMQMDGDDNGQLYLFDVEGKELPQKLAGQNPSYSNTHSCWSPDGKKIMFTFAQPKPKPKSNPE
jgi:TolB protein